MTIAASRPAGDPDGVEAVGYRFALVDGTLPDGLELPPADAEPYLGPDLQLTWIDGATDEQEAFSFTLSVIPVDAAGNEGDPVEVEVSDPGSEAAMDCSTAPGGGRAWALGLALAALGARRSRRPAAGRLT